MKKVKMTCECGYSEEHEIKNDECMDGLKCPSCEEPMTEDEVSVNVNRKETQ